MIYPPSAQLVHGNTRRKYRPLPFRPTQSHDRNGISSLGLSYTSIDHSAQRTNGSSTKASKRYDIVEARVLSDSDDRNGISSLGLSYTSTDHSAQRTNRSSTKVSKPDDIDETRVLFESENISDHTPPLNGIIISSSTFGGSR